MEIIKVSDRATRDELAECLANVNARAKRVPAVVGTAELPTEWDRRHQQLDLLLTEIAGVA